MPGLSLGEAMTIGAGIVGAIVWLVRLEGRINSHDRELSDVKDTHAENVTQLRADVAYIRDRIDRALSQ